MENTQAKTNEEVPFDEEHTVHMWTPFRFRKDESFPFFPTNPIFKAGSHGVLWLIFGIVALVGKPIWGLRIEGREKLKQVPPGVVTVCNHVHMLDCVFLAYTMRGRNVCFPTLPSNFQIPFIRHLIRLLGAVPILPTTKGFRKTMEELETHLKEGHLVHLYPEGVLRPYYEELRGFRRGAFVLAYDSNVPVLPFTVTFRKPGRIGSIFHKKPYVTISVLDPIYPDSSMEKKPATEKLKNEVFEAMNNHIHQ